jgi:hypothetical protein
MIVMKQKVTITRTDAGATTAVMSSAYEWSKSYPSWDQALDEAVDLQLLNKVESAAAKMMPPGFPRQCQDRHSGSDRPRLQLHERTAAVCAFGQSDSLPPTCGPLVRRSDKPWSEEVNAQPLDLATSVKLAASNIHKIEAFGDLPPHSCEKRRWQGYFDPNPTTEVDDAASHLPKVERYRQTAASGVGTHCGAGECRLVMVCLLLKPRALIRGEMILLTIGFWNLAR